MLAVKPTKTRPALLWTEDPSFPAVPVSFMAGGDWVERFRGVWKDREHITLLEARTALATVKHILRSQVGFSRRFLILGGSLGAILALSKGRACAEKCVL